MPLIVGVNSYLSADEADEYFSDSLYTDAWDTATAAQRAAALIMAARAIDAQDYRGNITSESQAMAWPRDGVYDREGRPLDPLEVPQMIGCAQAECALAILREDPAEARDPSMKRMKAGSVEVEYRAGQSATALRGSVLAMIKPFLRDYSGASARLAP